MTEEADQPEAEEETEDVSPGEGPIDVQKLFQTIIQELQAQPRRYKRFGIYWWPIKAMLKRAGYGKPQLYMLGGFTDPETARMVPQLNLEDTLRNAMEEYAFNTVHPHPDGRVENEDGEMVVIADDDAGF